jgi:uncharacterized membrane protein YbaN (DUF454 family)
MLKKAIRPLWFLFGSLSLALGAAGTILPLLPTTPFILLSAFAFARSSRRLHDWLMQHRVFGPLIENWQRYGAIDRKTKRLSLTVMALTPLITWLIGAPWWALLAQVAVLACSAIFIATRPEGGA